MSIVDAPPANLGFSPVWDDLDGSFFYVDGAAMALHRVGAGGHVDTWTFNTRPSSMVLTNDPDTVVMVLSTGIFRFDLLTGKRALLADPESGRQRRCAYNDAAVDAAGRIVVDTAHPLPAGSEGFAGIHRIDPDGSHALIEDHLLVGNGPCWSPDQRTFFHADTFNNVIHAYDYLLDSGVAVNRRTFVDTSHVVGMPAGAAVDVDGHLWSAIFDEGKVVRFRPDGTVERVVEVPVRSVSSLTFGGPDLASLFVTTTGSSSLETEPDAGRVFVIEGLGVRGMPVHRAPVSIGL